MIPIGVYSSIAYIDFVLQCLNNNNNNSSNNNNNNYNVNDKGDAASLKFTITFLHNVPSVTTSLDVYDGAKI